MIAWLGEGDKKNSVVSGSDNLQILRNSPNTSLQLPLIQKHIYTIYIQTHIQTLNISIKYMYADEFTYIKVILF